MKQVLAFECKIRLKDEHGLAVRQDWDAANR